MAIMAGMFLAPGGDRDLTVDLYLVAGNPKPLSGVDLLRGSKNGGVASVPKEALEPLTKAKPASSS